jgi:hypothetical protein
VLLLAAFISCVLRKPDLEEEEESFDDVNASSSASSADLTASQRDLQGNKGREMCYLVYLHVQ